MKFTHVIINALALRERLETDPTCVRVAPSARHVVAPFSALDGCGTARAFFHIVYLHPLLEQTVATVLTIRTSDALMVFDMAVRANACEARRARYDGIPRARGICLRAVGRRTIVVLDWTCLHVSMEGRQHKSIKFSGGKGLARQKHRYQRRALALITKATDRERPCIRRSTQISNKTGLAPSVSADHVHRGHGGVEAHRAVINARFQNLPRLDRVNE